MINGQTPQAKREEVFKVMYSRIQDNPSEFGYRLFNGENHAIILGRQLESDVALRNEDGDIYFKRMNFVGLLSASGIVEWVNIEKFKLTKEQLKDLGC